MVLLNTQNLFAERIYEFSFLMGIVVIILFYIEYKKCTAQIEKEEMLERFLKE